MSDSIQLPDGIKASDGQYDRPDYGNEAAMEAYYKTQSDFRAKLRAEFPDLQTEQLLFYHVPGCGGWVLCTLHISNPSSRSRTNTCARYYGIGVNDHKVYTVGKGPHVKAEATILVKADNYDRLKKYLELYVEGLGKASQIRDRISSRRAQGQLYRQQGRSSWRW